MSASWRCHICPEGGEGGWAEVDRNAERHTKATTHATTTSTVGAVRKRDADGNVRNVQPQIPCVDRENGPERGTIGTARTGAETPAGPDHPSLLKNERG